MVYALRMPVDTLESNGAYMVMGFDGDPEIAALEERKALEHCRQMGGRDLGRAPGEAWWEHRYDFYYPPKSLKLPWMYGTTETVTTGLYIRAGVMATVVEGTWYFGYGDRFNAADVKALPPGSYYTEPPNRTHFAETRGEPVILQITGFGPSATEYVDPSSDPRRPPR